MALVYAHPRPARVLRSWAQEPPLTIPRRSAVPDHRRRVQDGHRVADLSLLQELAQLGRRQR
uniref:Uncharacterized protein n=1 Tax=Arundo donax TaxID=35708 RepID=A0A0A9DJB1_ARUDO